MSARQRTTLALVLTGLWVLSVPGTGAGQTVEGTAISAVAAEGQLDLNQATLEEIKSLPISEALAESIHDYRTYSSYFGGLFQLMGVVVSTS